MTGTRKERSSITRRSAALPAAGVWALALWHSQWRPQGNSLPLTTSWVTLGQSYLTVGPLRPGCYRHYFRAHLCVWLSFGPCGCQTLGHTLDFSGFCSWHLCLGRCGYSYPTGDCIEVQAFNICPRSPSEMQRQESNLGFVVFHLIQTVVWSLGKFWGTSTLPVKKFSSKIVTKRGM